MWISCSSLRMRALRSKVLLLTVRCRRVSFLLSRKRTHTLFRSQKTTLLTERALVSNLLICTKGKNRWWVLPIRLPLNLNGTKLWILRIWGAFWTPRGLQTSQRWATKMSSNLTLQCKRTLTKLEVNTVGIIMLMKIWWVLRRDLANISKNPRWSVELLNPKCLTPPRYPQ